MAKFQAYDAALAINLADDDIILSADQSAGYQNKRILFSELDKRWATVTALAAAATGNFTFFRVSTPDANEAGETWLKTDTGEVFVSSGSGTGNWGSVVYQLVLNNISQDVIFGGDLGVGIDPEEKFHVLTSPTIGLSPLLLDSRYRLRIINDDDGTGGLSIQVQTIGESGIINNDGRHLALNPGGGNVFVGDPPINTNMTQGLTINQGANSNEIFTLKSSDVAHGMTTQTETNSYFRVGKISSVNGGCSLIGLSEDTNAIEMHGFATTVDTTDTTASIAALHLRTGKKSGTTITNLDATENMMALRNVNTTRWLIKGDGTCHLSVTAHVALDDENDILLIDALRRVSAINLSDPNIDKVTKLQQMGIVNQERSMFNQQKTLNLLMDSDVQLFNMIRFVAEQIGVTESELFNSAKVY